MTKFSVFVGAWAALLCIGAIDYGLRASPIPAAIAEWQAERAERYKSQAEDVSYSFLAGLPEQYQGKTVVLRGEVVQAVDNMLRVSVDFSSRDIVWVDYKPGRPRLREGDRVIFWGTYAGISSYKTVFGQKIELPHVVADIVEHFSNADSKEYYRRKLETHTIVRRQPAL